MGFVKQKYIHCTFPSALQHLLSSSKSRRTKEEMVPKVSTEYRPSQHSSSHGKVTVGARRIHMEPPLSIPEAWRAG